MASRIFHDLANFYAAVRDNDFDQFIWVANTDTYKEVRCRWLCNGEYDGGQTLIYIKH